MAEAASHVPVVLGASGVVAAEGTKLPTNTSAYVGPVYTHTATCMVLESVM